MEVLLHCGTYRAPENNAQLFPCGGQPNGGGVWHCRALIAVQTVPSDAPPTVSFKFAAMPSTPYMFSVASSVLMTAALKDTQWGSLKVCQQRPASTMQMQRLTEPIRLVATKCSTDTG